MQYRKEIDGLRAIAVLPVLFFHAGFRFCSGGFVGVDVFFVISGYLITSILLGEHRDGTFWLVAFYERRARRILPALFLVMLVCVPVAWASMLPDDLENFGQSLVATALSANNALLWITSGYFDLASEFKPLLHTWSLGVEEQFYIVFPLLLMLFLKAGRRFAVAAIAVLALSSLLVSEWGWRHTPDANFYLLHSRMWELMVGALVAVHLLDKPAAAGAGRIGGIAALLGLLAIGYAVVAFDKYTPFPSVYALVPTLGAALIILFATPATIAGKVLGSKPLVGIGLISYSAYLWHQPLFAFVRLRSLEEPPGSAYWGLSLLTLVLAWLTWKYVEKPFRDRTRFPRLTIFASSAAVGALLAVIGGTIYLNSGFVYLWSELNTDIEAAGRNLNAAYNEKPLELLNRPFKDPGKRHVLVMGNSFARDFINAARENHYFSGSELSYSTFIPNCLKGEQDLSPELRSLISQSDYVIFTPFVSPVCWRSDFEIFTGLGAKHLLVVGTKNFGWNLSAVMHLDPAARQAYRARVLDDIWQSNEEMADAVPASYFVNVLALIADPQQRVPVFTESGKIISQDRKHLTKDGARFIGAKLFEHPLLAPLK